MTESASESSSCGFHCQGGSETSYYIGLRLVPIYLLCTLLFMYLFIFSSLFSCLQLKSRGNINSVIWGRRGKTYLSARSRLHRSLAGVL